MAFNRGPWDIKWGTNTIENVEELTVNHEVDAEDFTTLNGQTFQMEGAFKVVATVTLLADDIAALKLLLPQYWVDDGEVMSTGETVDSAEGAMDIRPAACDEAFIHNHLYITSCSDPGEVYRIVNARTRYAGTTFDDKVRRTQIEILGEPGTNEATVQIFKEGALGVVS